MVETMKNALGANGPAAGGVGFWSPFAVGRSSLGNKTQYLEAKDCERGITLGALVSV